VVRAAFVLGFLLVGLGVPAELAQAQTSGRLTKDWSVPVEYLVKLNGVAFCRDDGPLYLLRGGMSKIDMVETDAHERKHVEQYNRFPNCKAFYKYYDTPLGELELEAEAFAAGRCAVASMGVDTMSLRQRHLQNLITFYVPGTAIWEAYRIYKKYQECH
jgi:hypothetical protein